MSMSTPRTPRYSQEEVAARHRLKELLTVKLQSEGQRHHLPHAKTQQAVLSHRGLVKREVDSLMKGSDKHAIGSVLEKLNSARRVHRKDLLAIDDPLVKTAVSRLEHRVFRGGGGAQKDMSADGRPLTARNLADHSEVHRPQAPLSARGHSSVSDYSSIRSSSRMSAASRWSQSTRAHSRAHARAVGGSSVSKGAYNRHNERLSKANLRQLDRALYSKISQRISGRNICIRAFRYFDRTKRNHIQLDDFQEVCVELGMGMSEREMKQLFNCYDLGRKGRITFDNFKQTLMNMGAQPGIATWSEEVVTPRTETTDHGLGDHSRAHDLFQSKAVQRGYDRYQLQTAFRRFVQEDTDDIDEESFAKACRAVGSNFSDRDLHDLFKKLAGPTGKSVSIHDLVDEFYIPAQHK